MKKNLFFLCALICSMSLFTSCGDDDEDTTWQNIPDSTKENTTLKINGASISDASASLDIQSAEAGVLTLTNAVYGHDKIDVPVAMTKSNDSTYVYEGSVNIDGAIAKSEATVDKGLTVTAKGTVTASGKLTADVTTSGWGTLSGVYSGDNLKFTTNNVDNSQFAVTLTATSESKATLVFNKILNVANDYSMEVTLTKEGEGYKIEGTAEKEAGYNITVNGNVSKNVLTLTVTTSGYATFSKSYSGKNLVYTYNGELVTPGLLSSPSASLKFNENTLDLTLASAVPGIFAGSNEINIKGVKYTKVADSETYSFSGTVNPEGFKASTLTFEGTVSADKVLTLSVDQNIQSDIVGKWSMTTTAEGMGKTFFDFQTASGMVNLPESIYNFIPENIKKQLPQQMPDQAFVAFVKQMMGRYTVYLKSIEFKANGNIAIVYSDMKTGKETTLDESYIHYCINDKGKLVLVPNIDALMGMMFKSTSLKAYDPYDPSNLLMGEGIPLNFQVNGGELLVSLDKGVIMPLGSMAYGMLPMLGGLIPADILPMINVIVPDALDLIKEIPTLEIGIYLKK